MSGKAFAVIINVSCNHFWLISTFHGIKVTGCCSHLITSLMLWFHFFILHCWQL